MKDLFKKIFSHPLYSCIFTAIFINLIIEILSRKTFSDFFSYVFKTPIVFLYNALIIMFTLSFSFLFRRRKFVFLIISVVWLGFGITNGIILNCRVTPFTATDFRMIKNGLEIASSYISPFFMVVIGIGLMALAIALTLIYIRGQKIKSSINYKKNVLAVISLGLLLFISTKTLISTNILADYFGNIAFAYLDYGFPYCFSNTLLNTGIKKPTNYSKETIANILNTEITEKDSILLASNNTLLTPKSNVDLPNIIMIQLESFFDPTLVKGLNFSQDPIPYFRELSNNYSSGYLNVPSVGAGTANTEFEVISGMSLDFFGPGEYPYKTILKDTTCESVNYTLKDNNYSTHAIHNNTGTFYDRDFVFSQLGFDTFTSLEYMEKLDTTPTGWSKDYVLTNEILKTLNSTDNKDFIYTISVQGHGHYPSEPLLENPKITVTGLESEEDTNAFTYYVNQLYEMDNFIQNLIDELSKLDEKVVLVMYGDHLPTLGLEDEDLLNNSVFQTEYVIWDNFNMAKEDKTLEAFQLTSSVLNRVGIDNGILNRYHNNSSNLSNYMEDLELLQYDMLYGEKYIYNGNNPFIATELKMGIDTISVSNVFDENEQVFVSGENFTTFSKVYINDRKYETIYISPTLLRVDDLSLESNDSVTVHQVTKGGTSLSSSNEFIVN
ncbi:LTA synthase family protein [Clostridium disporicum]|uniref:LTA synthase family protein n=1 Tax=Clostridium disporicum TaxID=84024 RepID=UPI0034A43B79